MTSVAELSRQVEDERRDLGRNLSELKDRAESVLDWREQVHRHPALAASMALAAGVLLAQMGGDRPRGSRRVQRIAGGEPAASGPGMFDTVGETLKATAVTTVARVLSDLIPGFREEHERRRP